MNEAVRDCLVTGHQDLIASLSLPGPDDRHVLAVAIRAGAAMIVTHNLTDFPAAILARFDIEALHPDDFLLSLLDAAPGVFCTVVKRQRESLHNPPKTARNCSPRLKAAASLRPSPGFASSSISCNRPAAPRVAPDFRGGYGTG